MQHHDHRFIGRKIPNASTSIASPGAAMVKRRRHLWELPEQSHCPVIGTCLSLEVLRKLASKVCQHLSADDYELHVTAVVQSRSRNVFSERIQQELERRYAPFVKQFRSAKTTDAVLQLWVKGMLLPDVAGTFWAALTHCECDGALQEKLYRDIHMLQHQIGANARFDCAKFKELMNENAILTRELARVQVRNTRLMQEKSSEIQSLHAQLLKARAESIRKSSIAEFAYTDLAAFKSTITELDSRLQLRKKLAQVQQRAVELAACIDDLRQQLIQAIKNGNAAADPIATPLAKPAIVESTITFHASRASHISNSLPNSVNLHEKTVLCVGGRRGSITTYRDLIERVGGRFAHHDGGLEESQSLLESSLAAADLVICQTGCISHNAYWRVKDFCKRTGKRCVFVENPSASSLARGLEQFSEENKALESRHALKAGAV